LIYVHPLRWHGRLRDEPARLPWGYAYEVELSGVYEENFLPASGGLRLSYSAQKDADGNEVAAPDVHAGDEITVTTAARRPDVFRDEGAFDRRAFLAIQNIDLVATLRAAELMERISVARPSLGNLIAKARRRLRDEVDTLFDARPDVAGVTRAMLLGDRSFVDRAESIDFQRTGVFHVLVVAGLHVGAIAYLLFWLGRRASDAGTLPAKNDDSIVMRWEFGSRAFLLPGDAEKQAERQILARDTAESTRMY
jgi:predicted membrane metal-binding protein